MGESIRLQKILANAGFGSRRSCEDFVLQGRVSVDGVVVVRLGSKADPDTQVVRLDEQRVAGPGKTANGIRDQGEKVYYILNKPIGVLCTNEDPAGRPLAVQLIPEKRRIYCVGRLDLDTEGLLLLTNDGELTHLLTHPSFGIEKTYLAKVDGMVQEKHIYKLTRGVHLAEGRTQGAKVRVRRSGRQASLLEITISEGLNRQVRRMLAAVDLNCRRLKRVRVGRINLGSLPTGAWRKLSAEEAERLRQDAESVAAATADRSKVAPEVQTPEAPQDAPLQETPREPDEVVVSDEGLDEFDSDTSIESTLEGLSPAEQVARTPAQDTAPKDETFEAPNLDTPSGADVAAFDEWQGKKEKRDFLRKNKVDSAPAGKPWDNKRGDARPYQKTERAPRSSQDGSPPRPGTAKFWQRRDDGSKPWERREARGPRTAGASKPWQKTGGATYGSQDRRPPRPDGATFGQRREGGGKPWERRDTSGPRPAGASKPWQKTGGATYGSQDRRPPRPDGATFGQRREGGSRPWERRDTSGPRTAGASKPWQKTGGATYGSQDRRPPRPDGATFGQRREGGGKPWERRDTSGPRPTGASKPWQKSGGASYGSQDRRPPLPEGATFEPRREGGSKPWEKSESGAPRPAGPSKPWQTRSEGAAKPWQKRGEQAGGPPRPWPKKDYPRGAGADSRPSRPWQHGSRPAENRSGGRTWHKPKPAEPDA